MPEYCTCGAELPPDARFCHKCGKPQREEIDPHADDSLEAPAELPPPPLPAPTAPPEIGFRNSKAVRIALLLGSLTFFLMILAGQMPALTIVLPVFAGFVAVYLYRRSTGLPVSIISGARMGWITGIFCFVIMIVFLAFSAVAVYNDPGLFREQMASSGVPQASIDQAREVFSTPSGVLFFLVLFFLMFTGLPAAGGALGAKFLAKEQ